MISYQRKYPVLIRFTQIGFAEIRSMGLSAKNYETSSVLCETIWRGQEMNGLHSATLTPTLIRIIDAVITDDTLSVDLEDGRTIAMPIGWYPRLAYGTPAERANFQISGAGYGLQM